MHVNIYIFLDKCISIYIYQCNFYTWSYMYLPSNHIGTSVHPGYLAQVIKKNYLRSVERGSKSQVQRWRSLICWRTHQFRGTMQTGKANIPWFTTGFFAPCKRWRCLVFLNRTITFVSTQRILNFEGWFKFQKNRDLPRSQFLNHRKMTRWWQLKYCIFLNSPRPENSRRCPILLIFFRWVGSTTN